MDDDVLRIEPDDPEIVEEWLRETEEPEIRGIGAHYAEEGGWIVDIWVQEFFRQGPIGTELRQRVQAALRGVDGVTMVKEHDNESWAVSGAPSGKALARGPLVSWMTWPTACEKFHMTSRTGSRAI